MNTKRATIALRSLSDFFGASLFFIPLLFVFAGIGLAVAGLTLDDQLKDFSFNFVLGFGATVDSARSVLTTVASATMTVAGIAFSIVLLIFQLSSSQYSPRVVHSLFRDNFNKRVMGLVVGTFTYCLIVLQATHSPLKAEDSAQIPTVSVGLALLLGVSSVLAIIAFIDHNAHNTDVSQILDNVTASAKKRVEELWPLKEDADPEQKGLTAPTTEGFTVTFEDDGWVQQVDRDVLFDAIAPNGTIRLHLTLGQYAIKGTPVGTIWPYPEEDDRDDLVETVRSAVHVGKSRTLVQDVEYGVRQLSDVALRALSPGVNDPTTAQDAIFHNIALLNEMFRRVPPRRMERRADGRTLLALNAVTHEELLDNAFREVRPAARDQPTVNVYLINAFALLRERVADDRGVVASIARHAELVLAESNASSANVADKEWVQSCYRHHFDG